MDIKEIQNLIKFVAKSGASEVKLEMGETKITIKTGSNVPETTIIQAAPQVTAPQVVAATPVVQAEAPAAQPIKEAVLLLSTKYSSNVPMVIDFEGKTFKL